MSTIQETLSHAALVNELTRKFAPIADHLVFGSLIYPSIRVSHRVNIHADAFQFLQRVLRKCPRRLWGDPDLKRTFVVEENEESGRHIHFVLEVPTNMTSEDLIRLCRKIWIDIALRERKRNGYWRRLNRGMTIHPDEKRVHLIKKNEPIERMTNSSFREISTTTQRPLADIKPVSYLQGVNGYILKNDGNEVGKVEKGDLILSQTNASNIKGHSPAMCLW